ncbi:glycoside hydrolase superfamily [Hypoxylon sp. FL1150]|nr:glycoside hydrolase superfamily [Hypoxylon sp. FL1150]
MKYSVLLTSLAGSASATIYYAGVAEAGGEFGVSSDTVGTGLPGTFGVDYQFIDEAAIDVHVDQNHLNLFRIAFLLERMCPVATGLGSTFNETHFDYYKDAVDYITITKGAYAILDPHNYMRYNDPSSQPTSGSVIGNTSDSSAATTAQFGEFWGELAGRFADNEKVIFEIMNEPHDMATDLVLQNNQAAIDAIRAAGATNLILMPGNNWTGGHSWAEGSDPNSAKLQNFTDPLNNTAIDVHEYLDSDYSGTHSECVNDPTTKLDDLTSWLEEYNLKAFITEFGGLNNSGCDDMLTGFVNYMADNDVYIGWTAWSAGPLWGSRSPCCTTTQSFGSFEPNSTANDGSPGLYDTLWLPVIQPLVPEQLQWSGAASVDGGDLTDYPGSGNGSPTSTSTSTYPTSTSTISSSPSGYPTTTSSSAQGWNSTTTSSTQSTTSSAGSSPTSTSTTTDSSSSYPTTTSTTASSATTSSTTQGGDSTTSSPTQTTTSTRSKCTSSYPTHNPWHKHHYRPRPHRLD